MEAWKVQVFVVQDVLPDGTVLVAGGRTSNGSSYTYLQSAEIYNPTTGVFTALKNTMTAARFAHAAAIVNGKVLIAGGANTGDLATAELYDPGAQTFTSTGPLATFRGYFTATAIGSSVLAVGGINGSAVLASAELYQGSTFGPAGNMTYARDNHIAVLLNNGEVLVAGGQDATGTSIATAELFRIP